jgi:hypothetical protein
MDKINGLKVCLFCENLRGLWETIKISPLNSQIFAEFIQIIILSTYLFRRVLKSKS